MAAVSISYKDSVIAQMDTSGSKTLETGGLYCEGDIIVSYEVPVNDKFRLWNVNVTGEISGNFVTILQDDWLKTHRADSNLCVAVLPKFTIDYDTYSGGTNAPQGLYLCTNSALMADSSGIEYKSIGAYVHKTGSIPARVRKYGLTNASDVGDLQITANGELEAVSFGSYIIPAGEYCVAAFLM